MCKCRSSALDVNWARSLALRGQDPELVSFGCGNASSHTPGLCQFNPVQGDFQVARWFVWHNLAASFRSNSAALS